jgi:N-acetylglutamate synthase-like GNAT family acetyltransferase
MRYATKYDMPHLIEMMKAYADEAGIETLKQNQNEGHVKALFYEMIKGRGFVLIDDQFRGFLAAYVTRNLWNSAVKELHEVGWWVMPEYRNTSVGGRLWLRFNKLAQDMLDQNRVQVVLTSLMHNSPEIDYTRYKFKPMQATFFRE